MTVKDLLEITSDLPLTAPVRLLLKEGNKIYQFNLNDAQKCPIRDSHGQYVPVLSLVTEITL